MGGGQCLKGRGGKGCCSFTSRSRWNDSGDLFPLHTRFQSLRPHMTTTQSTGTPLLDDTGPPEAAAPSPARLARKLSTWGNTVD